MLRPSTLPSPPWSSVSSALRLSLGLQLHQLCLSLSAPWFCLPGLHHGSSLPCLRHGPSYWLCSGPQPSSSFSCLFPVSSRHHGPTMVFASVISSLATPSSWVDLSANSASSSTAPTLPPLLDCYCNSTRMTRLYIYTIYYTVYTLNVCL